MSAKMAFQNKISLVFLGLVLNLFLYSPIGYTASISDEELERGLKARYQSFLKTSVIWHNDIGPAVQFVYHLLNQDHEDDLDQKLAMLIGRGAGVGGISQQPANEAERRVLFTGISKAKARGAPQAHFLTKDIDALTLEGQHQTYVCLVYNRLVGLSEDKDHGSTYHDFTRNEPAFSIFNKGVELLYSSFHEQALKLMASGREDYKRQLLQKGFSLLSTAAQREEFTSLIEEVTRIPVSLDRGFLEFFDPARGLSRGPLRVKLLAAEIESSELLKNLRTLFGFTLLSLSDEELIPIFTTLVTIPHGERQEFIEQVLQTQEKIVDKEKLPLVIKLFFNTLKAKRPHFIRQLLQVKKGIKSFEGFLDYLGEVSCLKKREIFMDQFCSILSYFESEGQGYWKLEEVRNLPMDKGLIIIDQASGFTDLNLSRAGFEESVNCLTVIDDLQECQTFANRLIQTLSYLKLEGTAQSHFLKEIRKFPRIERQSIVEKAIYLEGLQLKALDFGNALLLLSVINDPHECQQFVHHLSQILSSVTGKKKGHLSLLFTIQQIPIDKRQSIVEKVIHFTHLPLTDIVFGKLVDFLKDGKSVPDCQSMLDRERDLFHSIS